MRKDNIVWFKEIRKEDIPLVGGKGANLGEMYGVMPVPNGFCVTVNGYDLFLEETKINKEIMSLLKKLNPEDADKLDSTSEKIRNMINSKKMPLSLKKEIIAAYSKLDNKYVAVRSSATAEDLPTASFAGQQDTYLNMKGDDVVIDAVKRCWASLFTSRAIYYRHTNNFKHEDVKISIVVQEMVDSAKAGVMFTANPVTSDKNQLVIEGSYGLGESVVSGKVTPDTYIVQKTPIQIKEISIGSKATSIIRGSDGKNKEIEVKAADQEKQLLDGKEIKALAELGIKIELHYNKPQDIEWAIDSKGKVHILQSRPITTL